MAFGLTVDGFERKRLADIKAEIEASLKLAFGDNISLIPQSVFGQIIGVLSERESLEWETLENVYNSFYPSTATGNSLSELVLLNAIQRQDATKSTVTVQLTGTDGTIVTAGSIISTSDTQTQFTIDSDTTISGTTNAAATAVEFGEKIALSGTLTVIDTPIAGWATVNNTTDASLGREEETDTELRIRREASVGALGQNLVDSLFGQLLNVDGVTDVIVKDNKTNVTDGDGIPPHEFLSVVKGGLDIDIANIIWKNTPQGIDSFGTTTIQVTDAQGNLQDVNFTRPTDIDIYITVDVTTDANFPVSGSDDIKANVVSYGNSNFSISDDIIQSRFFTPVNLTPGIIDIEILIGTSPSPTSTANIPIALTELGVFDTSRVVVNVT